MKLVVYIVLISDKHLSAALQFILHFRFQTTTAGTCAHAATSLENTKKGKILNSNCIILGFYNKKLFTINCLQGNNFNIF